MNKTKSCVLTKSQAIALIIFSYALAVAPNLRADLAEAKELFVKSCASCHGKDGKAQTPAAKKLGVKDLSLSTLADAQIVQQIQEGKQDTQSKAKMPAFKEKLTPEQIQSLVPVVKEFRK
jgi:mono/diheme cytochrome c family protein